MHRQLLAPALLASAVLFSGSGCAAATAIPLLRGDEKTPVASAPSPTPTPQPFVISGSMSVPASTYGDADGPDQDCTSGSGYDDIEPGAQVTLTDATGAKIAIGTLGTSLSDDRGTGIYTYCKYMFSLTAPYQPDSEALYGVHIGNVARGEVNYKRADLSRELILSIG